MTKQVIFTIDKKLKDQAMKKAKHAGVPFASILKLATKAFVEGNLDIGLVHNEKFNPATRRDISKALKDTQQNKNISPRLTSVKEVRAYLNR